MNVVRIGTNIIIPLLLVFLMIATAIGYIAEDIRDYYNLKWIAVLTILAGYTLQFFKQTFGLIIIGIGLIWWFLL